MLVREVMTERPYTIRVDKPVIAVRVLCEWGNFHHMPVVDAEGQLVGMLSLTDVLRASASEFDPATPLAERERRLARITVDKLMRPQPIVVDAETTVADAARCMQQHRINCLPVMNRRELVGIITSYDLLAILARDATPVPLH